MLIGNDIGEERLNGRGILWRQDVRKRLEAANRFLEALKDNLNPIHAGENRRLCLKGKRRNLQYDRYMESAY